MIFERTAKLLDLDVAGADIAVDPIGNCIPVILEALIDGQNIIGIHIVDDVRIVLIGRRIDVAAKPDRVLGAGIHDEKLIDYYSHIYN